MRRNKNKYILFSLIGILLIMVVGFAAFNERLEIGDVSEVTTNWNILITDIKTVGGNGVNNTEPSYERLTASFDVSFENISDYIEYEITVSNIGDVIANLNDIKIVDENNDMVSMTYSGINVGDTLGINESKTFTVKLLYKGGSGEGTSEITINYAEEANPEEIIVKAEDVKITYDYETNGGVTGEITEKYFNEGESVDLNINAKKEGYTFIGWNTDKNATKALSSYSMSNIDTILYAIYKKEITVTYKLSEEIYKIGKENDTCIIYNNEELCEVTLPNVEVKEGYVLDGWYEEENRYEIGSEITLSSDKILEAKVYDNTPAELALSTSKTSRSITVVANAISNAPIEFYEYSIDGGAYIKTNTNTYTFDELEHDTSHNIQVKVTTKAGKTTESEITEVRTNLIETPTFKETGTTTKTVTITYPEGCGSTFTCSYIKSGGTSVEVTSATQNVSFTTDGTLIAQVTDGKNYITSSTYQVVTIKLASTLLKSKVVTSGDGLYKDSTESGRYVYKGAKPNNYIWLDLNGDTSKTDNEIYRIMSVEADNTIKVTAQNSIGTIPYDSGYDVAIDGYKDVNSIEGTRYSSTSSNYCYNSSATSYYGCNVWGSKTTMLNSSGNNITKMPRSIGETTTYTLPNSEAYLNTYLNGTFLNGINSNIKGKIATHTFNVGFLKIESGQTLSTDLSQERTYKWKGKIAIMNTTDYVKASTNSACTNVYAYSNTSACYNNSASHNYLFHSVYEWTLAPYSYSVFGRSSVVVNVEINGRPNVWDADNGSQNVFPVFYLNSSVAVLGSGTDKDPYVIVS